LDIRGRIADVPVDQLLRRVDAEEGQGAGPLEYARGVVEYCSYVALRVQARHHDHLRDREFHSLTFDMMLAWEAPDEETDAEFQVTSIIPFSLSLSLSLSPSLACKQGSHGRRLTEIGA
jgi:hypothetical protein